MESYNAVLILRLWHCIHFYVAMGIYKVYGRQYILLSIFKKTEKVSLISHPIVGVLEDALQRLSMKCELHIWN